MKRKFNLAHFIRYCPIFTTSTSSIIEQKYRATINSQQPPYTFFSLNIQKPDRSNFLSNFSSYNNNTVFETDVRESMSHRCPPRPDDFSKGFPVLLLFFFFFSTSIQLRSLRLTSTRCWLQRRTEGIRQVRLSAKWSSRSRSLGTTEQSKGVT